MSNRNWSLKEQIINFLFSKTNASLEALVKRYDRLPVFIEVTMKELMQEGIVEQVTSRKRLVYKLTGAYLQSLRPQLPVLGTRSL